MAKKVILIDDLDGDAPASETVQFGIDGINYEIDLNDENAQKLRNCLEPFAAVARRAAAASRPPVSTPRNYANAASRRQQLDAIRNWAKSQGYEVSDRGRIPVSIQEAFDQAH